MRESDAWKAGGSEARKARNSRPPEERGPWGKSGDGAGKGSGVGDVGWRQAAELGG